MISIPTYTTNPSGHCHPPRCKTPDLISRLISRHSLLSHQPLRHIPEVGIAAPVTVESGSNTISHSRVESRSNTFSRAEITRNLSVSAGNQLLHTKYILIGCTTGKKRYRLKYVPSTMTPFNWHSAFLGIGLQPPIVDGESGPPSHTDDMHVIIPLDSNGDNLDLPNRSSGQSDYSQRRSRYSDAWNELMPQLVNVFLCYQASTCHGSLDPIVHPPANCGCTQWRLCITCVYPSKLEMLQLSICKCPQLLYNFCLVVYLVAHSPNLSAWCMLLQEHLGSLGHLFDTEDSLVKRYSDALQSYQLLVQFAHEHISNAIATSPRCSGPISKSPTSRDLPLGNAARELPSSPGCSTTHSPEFLSVSSQARPLVPGLTHAPSQCALNEPQSEAYNKRPSAYLRSRCPICFGTPYQSPLKKHEGKYDRTLDRPYMLFLTPETLDAMKEHVEEEWQPTKPAFSSPPDEEHDETSEVDIADYGDWVDEPAAEEDFVERGMKVPVSALDACHESFTVADEACQKASTAIFADTGLMALLCEHDQAIYLCNMQTPGEAQYYALALLDELFKGLPPCATVGVLYDVSCQLHRSIVKWGFLPEWSKRMIFGISVFHAFGHQWSCQLTYNPRLHDGFGLADGEGCERFWSSIRKLIPGLCVSGFNRRLFVLDTDIRAKDVKSLANLGNWLLNKWTRVTRHLKGANAVLDECPVDRVMLKSQWKLQRKQQRLPHPRQSKLHGVRMVQRILDLRVARAELNTRHNAVKTSLQTCAPNTQHHSGLLLALDTLTAELRAANRNLERHEAMLSHVGGIGLETLRKIRGNRFFEMRMNRVHAQVSEAVKRRGGAFKTLANKINALINEMVVLKESSSCACCVDVAQIWDMADGALYEDWDMTLDEDVIPAWLCDGDTRRGIAAMVDRKRCQEEKRRLSRQVRAAINCSHTCFPSLTPVFLTENGITAYHIARRLDAHLNMGGTWHANLEAIDIPQPKWPLSMVHGIQHNHAALIATEVRQESVKMKMKGSLLPLIL
ncbi:hypothetical protein BS47DRAFT_1368704 [Hydnum rufescens UP504]|uniref:CxC1-like cysteine cluster associated with KDZ transposases domain-containing protein n=1 Tax=Hydnum rufescens UP504 TaxID=1448309 RepID=A0A9P6AEV6_9AGAM|nr:hypothetical protein BS47DRAFT_1368704 [Hydnum rufescens UP504]